MPMNTAVPYLDVKNFFNPHETYAGSSWQSLDQFSETEYASCIEREGVPAWQRSFTSSFWGSVRSFFIR